MFNFNKKKFYQNEYYILDNYKAIYILIPKVACTSIKKYIAITLGLCNKNVDERTIHHHINYPKTNIDEIINIYPAYYKFAFVRNPWDRLVSCFKNKIWDDINFTNEPYNNYIKGVAAGLAQYGEEMFYVGMSFSEFVKNISKIPDDKADPHFRSQHTFLFSNKRIKIDFIGKFENFENDFKRIIYYTNMPEHEIPHMMKSKGDYNSFHQYYDKNTKDIVYKRYKKDIKLFDYDFKNI